jgi:hypothetical protein
VSGTVVTLWRAVARRNRRRLVWAAALALAALLLVAHGCHGDEDHELLARVVRWLGG